MGAGVFTNDDVASGRDIVAGHDSAPTTETTVAPHGSRVRRALRSVANRRPRSELYRQLADLPAFAGCTRAELRRIGRCGEVIEVSPGTVLLREHRADWWFYVVLAGQVRLTLRRRTVASVSRGGHFGEVAVVGFGPQPATAVATGPCFLFVLGRRQLVTLVYDVPALQRALFPEAGEDGFRAYARRLFEEGRTAWGRLPRYRPGARSLPPSLLPLTLPGRRVRGPFSLAVLPPEALRSAPGGRPGAGAPRPMLSRRAVGVAAAIAALAAGALAAFAFLYHPPVAVMEPGPPIDVVRDITVRDRVVDRPTGRYLLMSVRSERRTLAGTLVAAIRGAPTRPLLPAAAARDQETLGHEAFRDSERMAVEAAASAAGVDPGSLHVTIRDRGLIGPSAGLVYALALTDMLDRADLARGRVIAATGELDPSGRVWPVGFVAVKAGAARSAHAALLLVPRGEESEARLPRGEVRGVLSVTDAERLLQSS